MSIFVSRLPLNLNPKDKIRFDTRDLKLYNKVNRTENDTSFAVSEVNNIFDRQDLDDLL